MKRGGVAGAAAGAAAASAASYRRYASSAIDPLMSLALTAAPRSASGMARLPVPQPACGAGEALSP